MSGRTEIYVQRVDRERATFQISTAGGSHPRWRHDGRELFYLSPELKVMAVEITLEPRFSVGIPKTLFEPKVRPVQISYQYDVSPDGQRFIVLRTVKDQGEPPLTVIQNWTKELADR
jgi:serine/threonine-protein kinase